MKFTSKVVERAESRRGDTTKLLVELQDGHRIESVVIKHKGHATVCVSSQVNIYTCLFTVFFLIICICIIITYTFVPLFLGGLPHGLSLLCHWYHGLHRQPEQRRDNRAARVCQSGGMRMHTQVIVVCAYVYALLI